MIKPIPPKMREEMSNDKFYSKCCLSNYTNLIDLQCSGKIDWHHNFKYKGQRVNEYFCILPVCVQHHYMEKRKDIKELLNWIMLNRAESEIFIKYDRCSPSLDYQKKTLNIKYGINY